MKLLDAGGSDFAGILQHFGVDKARLAGELDAQPRQTEVAATRARPRSARLWSEDADRSLDHRLARIRRGPGAHRAAAILALVPTRNSARIVRDVSKEFQKIEPEALAKDFARHRGGLARGHGGRGGRCRPRLPGAASGAAKAGGKTPNLDQYTVNLTENAKKGKIDPVLGRDFEIRQMVDILTRRRQNNPILTGEAGVGKTAVVEGFALRIVAGRRAAAAAERHASARSISRCCRPAPASRANSKTA